MQNTRYCVTFQNYLEKMQGIPGISHLPRTTGVAYVK